MTTQTRITASDYRRMNASPSAIVRRMKRKSSEAQLQKAVVTYLRLEQALGRLRFIATLPEGKRSPKRAGWAKAMGLEKGAPDIIVFQRRWRSPNGSLTSAVPIAMTFFFELKSPKGSLSASQEDFRDWATDNGFAFHVVRTLDDLKEALA